MEFTNEKEKLSRTLTQQFILPYIEHGIYDGCTWGLIIMYISKDIQPKYDFPWINAYKLIDWITPMIYRIWSVEQDKYKKVYRMT